MGRPAPPPVDLFGTSLNSDSMLQYDDLRRQYIITLSGAAEIGLKDGTIYRLGAGGVNLAEDLTGSGHTTRVVSDVPRVTATIHLEE